MITRKEAIHRLEELSINMVELKKELEEGLIESDSRELTKAFLDKCGGWEDSRSPEEIIDDIYSTRTISDKNPDITNKTPL